MSAVTLSVPFGFFDVKLKQKLNKEKEQLKEKLNKKKEQREKE
jgi:hypothetical protein